MYRQIDNQNSREYLIINAQVFEHIMYEIGDILIQREIKVILKITDKTLKTFKNNCKLTIFLTNIKNNLEN